MTEDGGDEPDKVRGHESSELMPISTARPTNVLKSPLTKLWVPFPLSVPPLSLLTRVGFLAEKCRYDIMLEQFFRNEKRVSRARQGCCLIAWAILEGQRGV
jgi:hypothetical protein